MSSDIAIKVENLSKRFEIYAQPSSRLKQFILPKFQKVLGIKQRNYFSEFWALHDVTFQVSRGETIGIIGRNGSGKSTLLQLICGTLNSTTGDVKTIGRVAALLELGSGFNPEFTGRENIYMNASVLGLKQEEIDLRFESITSFADIGIFIEQPVKTYSSGMLLRLAFAVIAHVDADILVIDEALAVGDAFFTQKCMRFLRQFMKSGTIIFVSHDTSAVIALCKRAIWIDGGKILKEGSPKDVANAYLQAFFEAQQGESEKADIEKDKDFDDVAGSSIFIDKSPRDMRQDIINSSLYRNELEIFEFSPDSTGFGKGDALIINVSLLDVKGRTLNWVVGGEEVMICVSALIDKRATLTAPILGFYVKDRLGQNLFGDNTYLSQKSENTIAPAGSKIKAYFRFRMPILPIGDYSIGAAIANGTQSEHVQHHWLHDAVIFKSHSSSQSHGLVGIPMHDIKIKVQF